MESEVMSNVVVAKQPNLNFLVTSSRANEKDNCPLPLIIKSNGSFDWDANDFLTIYGGGPQIYNIRPLAQTVVKKAYSLNLFCAFLDKEEIKLSNIDDSTLYKFIDSLKDRGVADATIITHGRLALQYIVHLSNRHKDWNLATQEIEPDTNASFRVHYVTRTFNRGSIEIEFLDHRSLDGLIHIGVEAEYVRDFELYRWLDAINCTTYHPEVNEFILTRWQALTTILRITGSIISEAHLITRSMIKEAAKNLLAESSNPIIRDIPIKKGKYKGKTRQVPTTKDDIQFILRHIKIVEEKFPKVQHDAIFVDARTGLPLKASYLKNYTRKVINGSMYSRELRHLSNHSFRHRFITLHIAKTIKKMAASGSFTNILTVAATACRKITMHASNKTLTRYVHLATEFNEHLEQISADISDVSTHIRIRIKKMITTVDELRSRAIDDAKALESLISTLDEFRTFQT